jgi:4-oxalomesaconate tautomerase
MTSQLTEIPCTLMRGGSSKGPFFLTDDLPGDVATNNRVLLAALGSPRRTGGARQLFVGAVAVPRSVRAGIQQEK